MRNFCLRSRKSVENLRVFVSQANQVLLGKVVYLFGKHTPEGLDEAEAIVDDALKDDPALYGVYFRLFEDARFYIAEIRELLAKEAKESQQC